jgi:hypothetical protein
LVVKVTESEAHQARVESVEPEVSEITDASKAARGECPEDDGEDKENCHAPVEHGHGDNEAAPGNFIRLKCALRTAPQRLLPKWKSWDGLIVHDLIPAAAT